MKDVICSVFLVLCIALAIDSALYGAWWQVAVSLLFMAAWLYFLVTSVIAHRSQEEPRA